MSDIGTRMKSYEANRRVAKGAVIIRVDGKSFHTWTKTIGASRPFDRVVMECMIGAMESTAKSMQGFKIAYTQSDEATFLLTNLGEKEELWFGGKLDKLVSVAASMFTYWFNYQYEYLRVTRGYPAYPAFFDARAHNIPIQDAANNFYWRQQDWIRNSVNMVGRTYFSHKELHNKNVKDIKEMLAAKGVSWDNFSSDEKFGTFYTPEGFVTSKLNYEEINELAEIDVTKRD